MLKYRAKKYDNMWPTKCNMKSAKNVNIKSTKNNNTESAISSNRGEHLASKIQFRATKSDNIELEKATL